MDDWRTDCTNIKQTWSLARHKGLFCDVTLHVGPKDSAKKFTAHKIFLACASPVFQAMFFGEFTAKDTVDFPEDDPEQFEILLSHVYDEVVCFRSLHSAMKAHRMAGKYQMPTLQAKASCYIGINMDNRFFWHIVEEGLFHEADFRNSCVAYLKEQTFSLLRDESFLEASREFVTMLVQMEELTIPESQLLMAVAKWCYRGGDDRRSELQNLLRFIRFSNMKAEEFCDFMERFPDAVDPASSLAILKHYSSKSKYPLPSWCASDRNERALMEIKYRPPFNISVYGPPTKYGPPSPTDSPPDDSEYLDVDFGDDSDVYFTL